MNEEYILERLQEMFGDQVFYVGQKDEYRIFFIDDEGNKMTQRQAEIYIDSYDNYIDVCQ